jgi:hypothetical protein
MNDFQFRLGSLSLPCTLGSISSTYVKKMWKNDNYSGYQLHPDFPLGNVQKTITPQGVQSLGRIAYLLPMFLGSFRGGRNEAFTFGIDVSNRWYDYDLTSCYTTVMSLCGDPDYNLAFYLKGQKIKDNIWKESYSTVDVEWKFPPTIKFPPLPVSVEKKLTIYPLEGRSVVTGIEYYTAKKLLNHLKNLMIF